MDLLLKAVGFSIVVTLACFIFACVMSGITLPDLLAG